MATGVLVAVGAAPFESGVLAALRHDAIHVVRRCVDLPDLLATAASRQADLAVVSDLLLGLDATAVADLRDHGLAVVGVVRPHDLSAEANLLSLGVPIVVEADDGATLVEAVLEHAASLVGSPTGAPPQRLPGLDEAAEPAPAAVGKVLAVWGATGAPGRSTVALGLAASLSGRGVPTTLIDADVYGGAIAQMLGLLNESSGLLAATREANRGQLDPTSLAGCCRQVEPSLRVLTGLPRADRWVEATSALVRSVLVSSRRLSDYTVVDCAFSLEVDEEIVYDTTAPRRNGATLEVLGDADLVVVVGRADPVGLSRLIRGLNEFRTAFPTLDPVVVVNRVRVDLGWSRDEMADTLARATGLTRVAWLPEDALACDRAVMEGRTLRESAPGARLTRAIESLADSLTGRPQPIAHPRLGRFRRRRAATDR